MQGDAVAFKCFEEFDFEEGTMQRDDTYMHVPDQSHFYPEVTYSRIGGHCKVFWCVQWSQLVLFQAV
jgi:hypothetical protein